MERVAQAYIRPSTQCLDCEVRQSTTGDCRATRDCRDLGRRMLLRRNCHDTQETSRASSSASGSDQLPQSAGELSQPPRSDPLEEAQLRSVLAASVASAVL